jgi:STE24 endopeptidase
MWMFYAGFQLLMTVLYPLIIAPLFNKFDPLDDPLITGGVMSLMEKAGLKAKGVYRVDALKRSRHSNAYFTGLGRSRRIVLFDSLLSSHTPDEILAVLAHEIGHWKKGHIRLQLCGVLLISLAVLYGAYLLIGWPVLYASFGIPHQAPYVGLLLLGFLMQPVVFFLSPLGGMISRAFERQADDFARALTGQSDPLIRALKRLSTDNLSNLHPHPLYAWFYYTHPPLVERIERLRRA